MPKIYKLREKTVDNGEVPLIEGMNPHLVQLLYNRGITDSDYISKFLSPSFTIFPSIKKFRNALEIVEAIKQAISENKKIFIHGDYDVDGMSATALLWEFLYKEVGADIKPYIPSREEEGYGLTDSSLNSIKEQGAELVITVDCGIRDHDVIEKWKKKGLEFIVTDHHQVPDQEPECLVMHPDLNDTKFFEGISGASVVWFLIAAFFFSEDQESFSYSKVPGLDLVALTVISDVMDSTKLVNRVLLSEGMKELKKAERPGLKRLYEIIELDPQHLTTQDLGYKVVPRLNSAGRVGDPLNTVRLLVAKGSRTINKYAKQIDDINTTRREITRNVYKSASDQINNRNKKYRFIWAKGEAWHEGVIGIVAGRLVDRYDNLSIVMSETEKGIVGSCRSIKGLDVVELLDKVKDYLDRFGGHSEAAGFTIKKENFDDFVRELDAILDVDSKRKEDLDKNVRYLDLSLSVDDMNWKTFLTFEKLRPFGHKNPEPLIEMRAGRISNLRIVGNNHLKLKVEGQFNELDCIGFNLGKYEKEKSVGDSIDLIGNLEKNIWRGRESLQFNIRTVVQ
jgi:single-stranded-DNA-specific exonuclease